MKSQHQMQSEETETLFLGIRHYFVLLVLLTLLSALIGRGLYLQIYEQDFLTSQGGQRQIRVIETPAYRGAILDRFGTHSAKTFHHRLHLAELLHQHVNLIGTGS